MKKIKLLTSLAALSVIGTSITSITGCNKNDVETFFVKFSATDGGKLTGDTTIKIPKDGKKWSELNKPTPEPNEGYDFECWYNITDQKFPEEDDLITKETEFKALFLLKSEKKTITIKPDSSSSQTIQYKWLKGYTWKEFKEFYELKNPEKQGYIFDNWYIFGTQVAVVDDYELNDDVTIEGRFVQGIKITYSASEGISLEGKISIEIKAGQRFGDIEKPKVIVPTSPKYVEYGWFNTNTQESLTDESVINADCTIKYIGLPESELHIVTFSMNGATKDYVVYDGMTVQQTIDLYGITPTEVEGFRFVDWSVKGEWEIKQDLTVKARYTQLIYDVEYNISDKIHSVSFPKQASCDQSFTITYQIDKYFSLDSAKWELVEIESGERITRSFDSSSDTTATFKSGTLIFHHEEPKTRKIVVTLQHKKASGYLDQDWSEVVNLCTKYEDGEIDKTTFLNSFTNNGEVISPVGYKIPITLNKQEREVRIIGVDHDDLSDGSGKAALTFELDGVVCSKGFTNGMRQRWIHVDDTEEVDWFADWDEYGRGPQPSYKKSCVTMIKEENPLFGDAIKTVKKHRLDGQHTTLASYDANVFCLTGVELNWAQSTEGTTYEYYKNSTNQKRIKKDINGVARQYWTSSLATIQSCNVVEADGSVSERSALLPTFVSFAFCI